MRDEPAKAGSSPYATGGGGGHLEQEYAGSALACLLLGQPVEGLGDEFTPTQVAMQQEAHSPVDDVVVQGVSPGGERTLRVACRHRLKLGRSSDPTIRLFADFVGAVIADAAAIQSGHLRLGLAVSGPFGPAGELAVLTEIARRQPSRASFEAAVTAAGAYSGRVRARLGNVDEVVDAALTHLGQAGEEGRDAKELSWRLLRGLFVIELQLEGDAASGRTNLVARLQVLTGNSSRAEDLRLRLVKIASQSAIRAGSITRAMLRHELRPFGPLSASPDFGGARSQITLLESELQHWTQRSLPTRGGGATFTLDRSRRQSELVEVISTAPASGVVLVRGEPDVGKSALTLAVIDSIRASGGVALAMSLRDLPNAAVELKATLGLGPVDLLAAAPSAPVSVLLCDGAEVVQERNVGALGALLSAAVAVGMTTVLVVRDDATGAVLELLRTRGIDKPLEFSVGPLSDDEISALVEAIPELAQLTSDPRAAWLLRRLGLVELLLRAAGRGSGLPETISSEAEIFATVWSSLIRQDEKIVGGVSPDDREIAFVEVARQLLTGAPSRTTTGAALGSLRSDGILLSRARSTAWGSGDGFVSDVLRDFATARLLLRDGLQVLITSSAPRWAIRATRLFAQARLSEAAAARDGGIVERWMELRALFAELSTAHGARWAELPWEALLTAGWADRALSELTPKLIADADMRAEAMRCVKLRFSEAGACNPMVGAPLVSWLVDTSGMLDRPRSFGEDPIEELVTSWLRGVGRLEVAGQNITPYRALRSRVRDVVLRSELERGENERLELLGLLGSESNNASAAALRTFAQDAPGFLAPVVESPDAAVLLAKQDSALLADLAEAYYVEQPSQNPWRDSFHDGGIRSHKGGGFGVPLAAWYRGPFLPLLRRDFPRGLKLINSMLDRGARRVGILADPGHASGAPTPAEEQEKGLELDLLGSGRRLFVGDTHVWSWYRGSSIGPHPCMSALFSLEMVLDEFVQVGNPPRAIATWLLRDATTLATPGLVFGFLVRHLEKITDELDEFLSAPAIWELEFGRVASEGILHVQGPDPADRVGRERRGWTPREVAMQLVTSAARRKDAAAVERLGEVGRRLVEAAGGETASPHVRQWAAHLDWDSFSLRAEGGQYVLEVDVPEDVVQAMAPARARSAKDSEMYWLLNRYRLRSVTPYRAAPASLPEEGELANDFHTAQKLEAELVDDPLGMWRGALAGVAAAVVHAVASGVNVPALSLGWAVSLLVDGATNPCMDQFAYEQTVYRDGADRKAALAIPSALLLANRQPAEEPPSDASDADGALEAALTAGTTSLFIEVRENAAEGLMVLLGQPCGELSDGRCWHELVWQAIEAGARRVVLGHRTDQGRRHQEVITGDLIDGLAKRPDRDLMLTYITPAAICTLDAAQDDCCISGRAEQLRDALLDAYARSACHWATENYDWRAEQHAAFASAVMRWAADEDRPVILELAERLRASPDALANFLNALAIVATHEASLVSPLATVWPQLMDLGLAVLREDPPQSRWRDTEKLIRNLMPDPSPFGYTDDMDAILTRARANWLPVEAVSGHIEEWLQHARDQRWCVDALIGFLQAQPISRQADAGLRWVRRLIVGEDGTARTSGFLAVTWLSQLRDSNVLSADSWPHYRALIDGLVLGNFSGARELQQRDE